MPDTAEDLCKAIIDHFSTLEQGPPDADGLRRFGLVAFVLDSDTGDVQMLTNANPAAMEKALETFLRSIRESSGGSADAPPN